jgi:chromate transporter
VAVPGVSTLVALALLYAQLSLLAFGGANAVIPEMQRQVVDVHHWMTAHEFAALYALAQAAPGPNMMVVSLVGWRVAGFWGALVTTGAVALPSSALTLVVSGVWYRFKDAAWRKALQAGLQPVTAGLIMASAVLMIESTAVDWTAALVIGVTACLFLCTKIHPLLILVGAAAAGAIGVVG